MKGKLNQIFTSFACSFGSIAMGLLNVWPSYTISLYASDATPLTSRMTKAEESLLGSLPSLGAMLGTAVAGSVINKLGRRNGGIVLSLFFGVSWAIVELSSTTTMVLTARLLAGISGGAYLVFAPMFISEIAEDSIRGALASVPMLLYCSGTLLSYIFGWFLTYRIIVWTNLVFSVCSTLILMFVAESPVYLMRQGKEEEARASIAHYRGVSFASRVVLDELSRLKQQIMPAVELISITADHQTKADESEKEKLNAENVPAEKHEKISTFRLLFFSSSSLRAFLVVMTVISAQVFMGMVPVQVYAKNVFTQTDPTRSDLYTVLFALVMVCGTVVTAAVADKAGRRILIITSSLLVCGCLSTLGYLLQSKAGAPWMTVLIILLYCFTFMFGAGAVPYVLLAEVFVPEVQGLASMLIMEWVWFINFFIIAVFPYMNKLLGIHGVFYAFAAVGLANAVVSYIIVPETKGLSNEQIQEMLIKRKN